VSCSSGADGGVVDAQRFFDNVIYAVERGQVTFFERRREESRARSLPYPGARPSRAG
jgi:hypothetical protein